MTQDEAKEFLSFHSGRHSDIEHPKWENGFLGSLRPYKGILFEENFHEVIECIRVLFAEPLAEDEQIDRSVVSDVMSIIHLGRAWGVYESGMLRRNGLIKENDWKELETWIDIISYTFMMVLDVGDCTEGLEEYDFYLDLKQKAEPDDGINSVTSLRNSTS